MEFFSTTQDDDQGKKTFKPWPAARPRTRYTFDRDGFYEIYCTVEKKNDDNVETAIFMTTVLIGPKPQMPTELPPILNIMRSPLDIKTPADKTQQILPPPQAPAKPEPAQPDKGDPVTTPPEDDIRL